MRIFPTLLAGALCVSAATITLPQDDEAKPKSIVDLYHELAEAGDMDGLVELWKANEYRALSVIDQDLEGSLSIWESDPDGDATPAAIAALEARAIFGGRAASKAFDRPIFLDYAAAFSSWNDEERKNFRAGQAAFGDSRGASRDGKIEAARDAAEKCTALALPLGDWWGTAMGLGASGSAKVQLGDLAGGISDLSQARLINQSLGLRGSELSNLKAMLGCLVALGHTPRAIAVCEELLEASEGEDRAGYEEQLKALLSK